MLYIIPHDLSIGSRPYAVHPSTYYHARFPESHGYVWRDHPSLRRRRGPLSTPLAPNHISSQYGSADPSDAASLYHWDVVNQQLDAEIIHRKRDLDQALQRKRDHENRLRLAPLFESYPERHHCSCGPPQHCAPHFAPVCAQADAHRSRNVGNLPGKEHQTEHEAPQVPTQPTSAGRQSVHGPTSFRDVLSAILNASLEKDHSFTTPSASHLSESKAPQHAPQHAPRMREAISNLLQEGPVDLRSVLQAFAPRGAARTTSAPAPAPSASAERTGDQGTADKGKGKAVHFEVPISRGPVDVYTALDTISRVESEFFALESDFVFPAALDVNKNASALFPNATDADTDSVASIDSKLSYSSRNAPVRFFLHSLTALLSQLDAVESHGNEVVRERRKEVVDRVENALEDVERTIAARLASATATAPAPEAIVVTETSAPPAALVADDNSEVDALPVVLKSPVVTESTETNTLPAEDQPAVDIAPITGPVVISFDVPEKTAEPDFLLTTSVVDRDLNVLNSDTAADVSAVALEDDLASSHTSEATITAADKFMADTESPSGLEQDTYLLRDSDEPSSLSETVVDDQIDLVDDLVVVDDAAGNDAGSDWSEVDA